MKHLSKLPASQESIFSIMSGLARKYDAINLGQGFPDFDCAQGLKDLVSKYVNFGKNQYCPMPGAIELRTAISAKINTLYGTAINPDQHVCVTAGATQAIFTAINAFIRSGDEVIVFEPAYDSYTPTIQLVGGNVKPYRMVYPDYKIDWSRVEDMITEKTKMIIINTPHNPTGTVLKASDLEALENLVVGKDIIVLSDEVYEHLIYDGEVHQSVLRYPRLLEQSLAVFSFGKTFHNTGWKVGYIVGQENLIREVKNIHQWNVFSVNSFSQYALAEYLQQPEHYLELPNFFQEKRDYMNVLLHESPLQALESKGTFFQLFNYKSISDLPDTDFAKMLTEKHGVASIPLSPFYSNPPRDNVVRLCFAKKESTIELAAERLCKIGN